MSQWRHTKESDGRQTGMVVEQGLLTCGSQGGGGVEGHTLTGPTSNPTPNDTPPPTTAPLSDNQTFK